MLGSKTIWQRMRKFPCAIWSVRTFPFGSFLGIGSLVFSGAQHIVRGSHGVMAELDVLKKNIFADKNGENRPGLGFA